MSALKHTPGPWKMNGSSVEQDKTKNACVIAHVYDDRDAPPEGSARANAALIAAAPALLEVAQMAEVFAKAFPNACAQFTGHELAQKARAALAKAGVK